MNEQELKRLAQEILEEIWKEPPRPVLCYALKPGEPGIFESKVGGTPYLPHDMDWPLDNRGNPLDLLAQVDCVNLKALPDFPHEGILQFFIARDDVYGVDFDDGVAQTGFRVLYHESVDTTVNAKEVQVKRPATPESDEEYYTPICQYCHIVFGESGLQDITEGDYRVEKLFVEKWNARCPEIPLNNQWDFFKLFSQEQKPYDIFSRPGKEKGPYHQLGGWPYFTQSDPRYMEKYQDLDVLLFQLDSDSLNREDLVLWGDCGICNFFISPEALKNRNFSRVLYNWDCC